MFGLQSKLVKHLSFTRKFADKSGKKLMDTATKTGIDAAKTASKRVVKKAAEATRDLIGNTIADKITSIGESIEKGKTKKQKKFTIYMTLNCFEHKI